MNNFREKIISISQSYSDKLKEKMHNREEEMKNDNLDHYLIYQVLGISEEEGYKIDLYQNKGRFLYKYAGSFLEDITIECFKEKFRDAKEKEKVENNQGNRPKKFEIDCLVDNHAYEIKWRDATTDGDHITKEHTRAKCIKSHGYIPIRIMFFYPNRSQAIKIQDTIKTIYTGLGGKYYFGDDAWEFIKNETGIDLKNMLIDIAQSKTI
ncbi:MAG: ApaLI family restriction endonuclease [Alphaproteobacteria bacterium]|jgi:type II restriction enzyme|nr:ApaLI family restriction endonuclease [Alphaproteobacteria bacterium]